MQVRFSAKDIDNLFMECGRTIGTCVQVGPSETLIELLPHVGKGYLQRIKLRPGLEISIEHFEVLEPFMAEISNHFNREVIEFKSSLSGYAKGDFSDFEDTYHLAPRQSRISFAANCGEWIECQPHEPIIHVEVNVEPSILNNLIGGRADQVSGDLRTVLAGRATAPLSLTQTMSQATFQAAEQILNCPYQGLTRQLFLESRALELIALQLPLGLTEKEIHSSHYILKKDEVDRIHYAKKILLNNLENPPSLLELAQRVGLNDYKLKRGFRQVFGTTAFGCLYQHRMERAKILLQSNYSTVTEVAQAVGYASTTSFSAAFKKKFGMSPRNYKLRS
ncbi:transcriptional family [Leptolyngbya sp. Heron Island J]|uniref:helix-turn-helix transcriptional regulator n=1 Tax=Leptolyngbya sp. Heron Island J TaxID=1385935 RepID=UPI0003B9A960|nr:AraC family transcriptional regulator [Leptolyngbya sp. Heron Island J]ESA35327.1 transcriptional family [Leptolyngbya sp. Heron Island J]